MKILEDMVKDLDQDERVQLIGILKKSVISEEMASLEEELKTATTVLQRITIKGKMHDLTQRRDE